MATWAIGDIQGCFDELVELLDKIEFRPERDRLWLVGDLVNRGPKSLETLRFVRGLGAAAIAVLGNHDFHLLAVAAGVGKQHKRDTLDPVLKAHDRDTLIDWLRHRPLLHHDKELGYLMVHAGLAPGWDLPTAKRCAMEVESALRSDDVDTFY
ncbi:MAG: symmetrical bis(5'-nucleosyl)-tetraphosphatase, partial [Gammaproteobacteria bacterium]